MKIDNSGRLTGQIGNQTTPVRDRSESVDTKTTNTSKTNSVPQDTVSLSQTSQLQSVNKNLANVPVVNADKVKEIKEAIAQGKFSVNPEAIADGLIDSVRDLLADRKANY
ncbi:flagellar biosynthesis anti-sigma factor FlgM [Leeia oryzae]|uniref:flagellar biosynthesis anti-sigma factor FlgM n=1 Tax=Leeia oryzae TaxID=356662 RepID=UPI000365081B|nr:flagellar biosynthesis anti-sigma factor FlgM [Leeia oryzae]